MKWKSKSLSEKLVGIIIPGKKIVLPNQAMSLEEILSRFTRGEPLPIGQEVNYHESEDDLEKVSKMDLVDREEYIDRLKSTQREYREQETRKQKKERERLEKLAQDKIEQEVRAAQAAQEKKP